MHEIWYFWHFSVIFTSKKIEIKPISCSTIIWSNLGLYYYLQEVYEEDDEDEDQTYEYESDVDFFILYV